MRKESGLCGASLLVLLFGTSAIAGALFSTPAEAQYCCFNEEVDGTNNTNSNGGDFDSGKPHGTQSGSGGGTGDGEGGIAPDVPTEQPKGVFAAIKRSLVKKIWNSLTADQQQQAKDSLREWLEEQGYSSCHQAAANPEESRAAAEAFLGSHAIQLTDQQRKWANRLLGWSSPKGTAATITIICDQVGL